jgi:glucose/arabinose dehydrogenase
MVTRFHALFLGLSLLGGAAALAQQSGVLTGQAAFGDFSTDAPGVRRKITVADIPKPFDTPSVDRGPQWAPRPAGALPKAPTGFTVSQYASGLQGPRVIQTAPNGDLFVVESDRGRVQLIRDADGDGKPELTLAFAQRLKQPFGLAFYPAKNPQWVYVANTDSVVRFPYRVGDLAPRGDAEVVVGDLSGGGRLRGGGHWTRDLAFSKDEKRMYVSIGSLTNVNTENLEEEERRARIFSYTPEGKDRKVFAWGIRNAVGLATNPKDGQLWMSVNERDGLGDMLPSDYISSVKEYAFYGWPWYYLGDNEDPRHAGKRPDLKGKVTVPDVLLQAHSASLDLAFYTGKRFPRAFQGNIFACEHGSWNRARRTGYKVVHVPLKDSKQATGEYEDFLTGFVVDENRVWGRPVGVTVGIDEALYITDDFSGSVWRVAWGK